jgi:hypothetical protein
MAERAACESVPAARVRRPAACRGLALILLLSVLFWPPLARPYSPQEVQKAAEQVIRHLDLQTELPRGPEPRHFSVPLPPELLWLVVAVGVGVLLYAFRDLVPFRRRRSVGWSAEEAAAGVGQGRAVLDAALEAADDLAARGRFVEAMHVLLLQGLADIRRGLGEQFADSLTSREILHRARLPEVGRSSLRDIMDRVEWTYFGEHAATLSDYAACRVSFDQLAQVLQGRAVA